MSAPLPVVTGPPLPRTDAPADQEYDAVIIGSGFGGAMCAHELVSAGWRVLMIERGDWVPRGPRNWAPDQAMDLASAWGHDAYEVGAAIRNSAGAFHCVGGPSVYYGGASLRYRIRDFEPAPEITGDTGTGWPFGYDTLEPWYCRAEQLIGVVGDDTDDPTAPPRSVPARHGPALSRTSQRISAAARALGLTPSILPLAINWGSEPGRARCASCNTCDAYACAIGAKNDMATAVLPRLLGSGLTLVTNSIVVRLHARGRHVSRVDCVDARSGARASYRGRHVVLAAGALASPHLILASGLERFNPSGHLVGRFLMRHCNAMVYGLFREPPNPELAFHKQVAFFDAYFGHPTVREPAGKLGCIQQVHAPPTGVAQSRLPRALRGVVPPLVHRSTGLLVIAEDQPQIENRVAIDPGRPDVHGLPRAIISHRYAARDLKARRALARLARGVLREAGAIASLVVPIGTFSHALGTLRMGTVEDRSPVDPEGRFRGLENLWVADGSVLPTAAAVNPSLTIAANALRIARRIAETAMRQRRTAHGVEPWSPSPVRAERPVGRRAHDDELPTAPR